MKVILLWTAFLSFSAAKGYRLQQDAPPPPSEVLDVGMYYSYRPISRSSLDCGDIKLPLGCSVSADCSFVKCDLAFAGQTFGVNLKIDKCAEPFSVTVGVKIPFVNRTFVRTFEADRKIPIPTGIGEMTGMLHTFLNVVIHNEVQDMRLVVSLEAKLSFLGEVLHNIKLDVINGYLPLSRDDCLVGGENGEGRLPARPPGSPGTCRDEGSYCFWKGFLCKHMSSIRDACPKTCQVC